LQSLAGAGPASLAGGGVVDPLLPLLEDPPEEDPLTGEGELPPPDEGAAPPPPDDGDPAAPDAGDAPDEVVPPDGSDPDADPDPPLLGGAEAPLHAADATSTRGARTATAFRIERRRTVSMAMRSPGVEG
jgi:hypothetical protein